MPVSPWLQKNRDRGRSQWWFLLFDPIDSQLAVIDDVDNWGGLDFHRTELPLGTQPLFRNAVDVGGFVGEPNRPGSDGFRVEFDRFDSPAASSILPWDSTVTAAPLLFQWTVTEGVVIASVRLIARVARLRVVRRTGMASRRLSDRVTGVEDDPWRVSSSTRSSPPFKLSYSRSYSVTLHSIDYVLRRVDLRRKATALPAIFFRGQSEPFSK